MITNDGVTIPVTVKPGDIISFIDYEVDKLTVDGEDLLVMQEQKQIIGIFDPDTAGDEANGS